MRSNQYKVSFKDEQGTYEVEIQGHKKLGDAKQKLLQKLREQAVNYVQIKDVKFSQETESTLIQECKPEQLTNIKCFVEKYCSLKYNYFKAVEAKLNATAPSDEPKKVPAPIKIKVIEEELNTLNSSYPQVTVLVKSTGPACERNTLYSSTDSEIVQYVQFNTTLSEIKAKVFEMEPYLDQSKTFYFTNFGKIVLDEDQMLNDIADMGKVDLVMKEEKAEDSDNESMGDSTSVGTTQ